MLLVHKYFNSVFAHIVVFIRQSFILYTVRTSLFDDRQFNKF